VKLLDDHGVEHSARVRAKSVYEAALLGFTGLERVGWESDGSPLRRNTLSRFVISTQSDLPPKVFGCNEKKGTCVPLFQDATSTLSARCLLATARSLLSSSGVGMPG
jgi:hypothetical protein